MSGPNPPSAIKRAPRNRRRRAMRRGLQAIEVVLVTGLFFPPVVVMAVWGIRAMRVYFCVLSTMLGSPYM